MRYYFVSITALLLLPACVGANFSTVEAEDPVNTADTGNPVESDDSKTSEVNLIVIQDLKSETGVKADTAFDSKPDTSPEKSCAFHHSCILADTKNNSRTECIEVSDWWWTSHSATAETFCNDVAHDRGLSYRGDWSDGNCAEHTMTNGCLVAETNSVCPDNMNMCKP